MATGDIREARSLSDQGGQARSTPASFVARALASPAHIRSAWIRLLLVATAVLELALGIRDLGRNTDAQVAFINALACVSLATVVMAACGRFNWRLPSALVLFWVGVGGARAIVSLLGVPQGWTLTQTIQYANTVVTTRTHTAEISFGAGAVPSHLVNDGYHFDFYDTSQPDRTKLPVSIKVSAFVAGNGALFVTSSDPVRLTVGSDSVLDLPTLATNHRMDISVAKEEPVEILMAPAGIDRAALTVRLTGVQVFAEPTSGPLMSVRRLLGGASRAIDMVTALGTVWLFGVLGVARLRRAPKERRLSAAAALGVTLLVLLPALWAWVEQRDVLVVLSGGDDWLTYETFARDIRANSLLMLGGRPIGHADPFYYQVLYPYVLALGHLTVGESVQGILLLQYLGLGVVLFVLLMLIPEGAFVAALVVLLGTGIAREWVLLAGYLLSENLLMALIALLLLVVSRMKPLPSTASLVSAGLVMGAAVLARSSVWVAVPFVVAVLCRGLPRSRLRVSIAALVIPVLLLASLIPARNLVAAGSLAPLPTSGSGNFFNGNIPPGRSLTAQPWADLAKSYDPRLIAFIEAVENAPGDVAGLLGNKVLYVLGFPRSMGEKDNPAVFWPILLLWLMAPLGLLARPSSVLMRTCAILILSHVALLVVYYPNNYYYRMPMPATVPLVLWDIFGLSALLDRVRLVTLAASKGKDEPESAAAR